MAQTLFITGASTGIGKATALHFRKQGWNVAATLRNPAADTELADAGVHTFALDVTDTATIQPALDGALKAFGRIDALVNNAGYGTFGPFEAATDDQIERQYATNVTGLMLVTRAFLPHFRANGAGVIVNISSVGGVATFPFYSLYHGTKWAIEGFSESLNFELNGLGIRVKLVEPGAIATDFGGRSLDVLKKEGLDAYDALLNKFMETWAAGRVRSTPELVAEVIWQAATDGSNQLRYIAGDDAKMIIEARGKATQAEYYAMIRQRLGV
ncbi:MAG TPA: SDR family oxidoreductase [Bryobacteraceae bacterium]|jgi:NAD(P)-dependent dehydrogenase (short-subunit alcohol dehydrogenase family)|nr:SDR family oxidoreductase [Bryobacteraceae bacterium]